MDATPQPAVGGASQPVVPPPLAGKDYLQRYARLWGGKLPRNYIAFDIETTGFSRNHDLLLDFGYCVVEGGYRVASGSTILNWGSLTGEIYDIAQQKLYDLIGRMRRKGVAFPYDWRLILTGSPPHAVQREVNAWLLQCAEQKMPVVFHYGYRFDIPFIEKHSERLLSAPLVLLPRLQLLDTAALEKGLVTQTMPQLGEDLFAFNRRALGAANAGTFSLWETCVPKYCLELPADYVAEKKAIAAANGQPFAPHGAETDAVMTHMLVEKYHQLLEA